MIPAPALRRHERSPQIEQAEARQAHGFEQLPFEILLFEHGELGRAHFSAIGAKLKIEFTAGAKQLIF